MDTISDIFNSVDYIQDVSSGIDSILKQNLDNYDGVHSARLK